MSVKSVNPQEVLENEIIQQLQTNRKYFTNVIHHLKPEYFAKEGTKEVFKAIKNYYLTYKDIPSLKELILSFRESPKPIKDAVKPVLAGLKNSEPINTDQLLDQTERWIKMAIFKDAIIEGADSLGANDHDRMRKSYAKAEEAIKVNLTSDLGVSLEEIDKRYDDYLPQNGLKLNISSFDTVIGDGYTPGTLHLIISPSGVGKSAMLSTFAVQFLLQGKDVAIVSLEMAESQFYKRIDANITDIPISDLGLVDKQVLKNKYESVKGSLGRMIIKEYPAGQLTPLGLDGFLDQLRTEKGIDNPVVMVDYLTLMKSDLLKSSDNSYSYYKSVAEELRAVAQKRGIILFTPMQSNRSSVNNLEADQSTLSDSMAVYMTADSAFMILQTKEMKEKGEMRISFVKNRMTGKTWDFNIYYDYAHFRVIDNYNINGENITASENKDPLVNQLKTASLGSLMSF